jgi:hypothetical protein
MSNEGPTLIRRTVPPGESRGRNTVRTVAALSFCCLAILAQSEDGDWPTGLTIDPNAIQAPQGKMGFEVSGVPQGGTVWLQVLRDCNDDKKPDVSKQCAPLYKQRSEPAGKDQRVVGSLDFAALAADGHEIPTETILWLRVGREKNGPGPVVRFGLVANPCSLWETVVDVFLRGECNPGLAQALRRHRGEPSGLLDAVFEVRLVALDKAPASRPLPATRGATGVAWLDRKTLVVTMAQADEAPEDDKPTRPGLYRVSLRGDPERLWAPDDDWMPVAPLTLPGGRIAFVRQRLNEQLELTGQTEAYLHILANGRLDDGVELPYKIHQLVAADAEGHRVLALTLGVVDTNPAFLDIDLATGEVRYLGYDHSLYHAVMRSPVGTDAVIAMEDNSDQYGWDLVLVDEDGKWKADLQNRLALHELLPTWRPDGREIAFLAEVGRVE